MNAEIIAVGSELLSDSRLDTNSLYLTAQLNGLGVEVAQKAVIGDDLVRLTAGIRDALVRSEIIIITGGLGPTEDDLTRDAVAAATGRPLILHEEIVHFLVGRFARLQRKMPEINKRQAYLLEGAIKLENPNGTAPGQWLEQNGRIILLLPGPPREMKPMVDLEVIPRLRERLPQLALSILTFRVAGMPESEMDQLISPVYKQYTNPVTTVLAKAGDLQVILRARAVTQLDADAITAEVGARIEALLGDRIYSRNGDAIEVVLKNSLVARGETLSVAESCTGGLLGARLTEVPGSSAYFRGGFLVYTAEMKTSLLGVPAALIGEHTVVSEPIAIAMANGVRERTGSTWGLSITGEAGPESSTPGVSPGTVVIGLAGPLGAHAHKVHLPGNRDIVRGFAVMTAMNLLRRSLV